MYLSTKMNFVQVKAGKKWQREQDRHTDRRPNASPPPHSQVQQFVQGWEARSRSRWRDQECPTINDGRRCG